MHHVMVLRTSINPLLGGRITFVIVRLYVGVQYHDCTRDGDNYPDGDPSGVTPESLVCYLSTYLTIV
jgi:hypothetical protein